MDTIELFKKKFETYRKLLDESGEKKACDTLYEGYPERQRKNMGMLIDNTTLAAGFTKGIPLYKKMGMDMEVIDISTDKVDAVIEVQRSCPALSLCKEYGFDKPCHVICEMDVAATKAAFPDMEGGILGRMADGECVCLFKYERPKK
jgi:L-2-amino-thiazoline-4-carboxylic acid hydrolase-like protein